MASLGVESDMSSADFVSIENDMDASVGSKTLGDSMDIMTGAQVSDRRIFKSKTGRSVAVTPVILDIRRLLQTTEPTGSGKRTFDVIAGIPNQDLVHAVVGLYDVALPEMTPDILYSTVGEKWARSILLVQDVSDILSELNQNRQALTESSEKSTTDVTDNIVAVPQNDVFTAEESGPNTFDLVYSDNERGNPEESDDDEEEDFSKGIYKFIKSAQERRLKRRTFKGLLTADDIGIEDRLVACATFEKKYCKPGEKVIHLTVIATRKKYRQMGVGKYLLQQLKDPLVVGHYDVIVVHADNSAIDFFEHYGFTSDVVLNSRWSELAEQFTNCTMMCYLPPFTGQTLLGSSHQAMDILTMEREIKQWQEKSLQSYQSHISLVTRLKHEIIHLRALVLSQQDLITNVSAENEKLQHEKFLLEKEFLQYKLSQTGESVFNDDDDDEMSAEANTQYLISRLEKQLNLKTRFQMAKRESVDGTEDTSTYMFSQKDESSEAYDHGKDMAEFYQVNQDFNRSCRESDLADMKLDISLISKALVNSSVLERYAMTKEKLQNPNMTIRLYYCGTFEHPERIPDIVKNGFSEKDFSHGEYGCGLYFSKSATKAMPFSAKGKLIIADVAIGNAESIIKKDNGRTCPSEGYDSTVTPGRLVSSRDDTKCQEYVIFNFNQALPLFLIDYSCS